MKQLLTLFFLLPLIGSATAGVLNKGRSFARVSSSFSTSTALWIQGHQKSEYRGSALLGDDNRGRRNYYVSGVEYWRGFGNGFQGALNISYGVVKQYNAPILGAKRGQSVTDISDIGLRIDKSIYKVRRHEFFVSLRYSHPGKKGIRHPEFLSFNDFTETLSLAIFADINISKWVLNPLFKYKKALSSFANDQYIFELKSLYRWNSRLSFGPGIDHLYTFGGFDVADSGFNAHFARTGFIPVWNKHEKAWGLSVSGNYVLTSKWNIDSYIHQRVRGNNTDIGTTIGAGVGYLF